MNSTRNSEVNSAATGDAGEQIVVNVMGRREATVRRWPDGTLTLVDQNFKKWMRGIHEHEPNETPSSEQRVPKTRHGLTLLELVVVLLITVALAGVMVPLVSDHAMSAQDTTTDATLIAVRDAVIRYWQDSGSLKLVPTVHELFAQPMGMPNYNPRYKVGWNGPYLSQATGSYEIGVPHASFTMSYGNTGDRALIDAWGNPVVIQDLGYDVNGVRQVRIVSAGRPTPNISEPLDLALTTSNADLLADPTLAGDDRYVAFTLR